MDKKSVLILVLELTVIFLLLFLKGQLNGVSAVSSDINMTDEGQFAAWISHMLHGKLLYKDMHVPYGPLLIYPIFFFIKFFGATFFYIRFVATTVYVFLGISVAIVILKYLKPPFFIEMLSTIFLVLIPGIGIRQWIGILCVFLIVYAFEKQSLKVAIFLGVVLAIALLGSAEVGIISFVIVILYGVVKLLLHHENKKNIKLLLAALLSFLSVLGIFTIISSLQGWFTSYVSVTWEILTTLSGVNLANGQGLPPLATALHSFSVLALLKLLFAKTMLFYWSLLIMVWFVSFMLIRVLLGKFTSKDSVIFLILCFGMITYASIIGRSGHYFVVVPIIILCTSYFLSLIFSHQIIKNKTNKLIAVGLVTLFIFYGLRHMIIYRYTEFFLASKNQQSNIAKVAPLRISNMQAKDIEELQVYFANNSTSADMIFTLDNDPAWYFLLNRENPTRYDVPFVAFSHQKRMEIVDELQKNPPLYIIEDTSAWAIDGVSDRKRLPEVIAYIQGHYKKATQINHYLIYKRFPV